MSIRCPCGCGVEGEPRKKAWRDGLGPHVRRCPCRRCVGSRQRGKARGRENQVALDTGGTREPLSGGISGIDGRSGSWVWEETAEVAVGRGLRKWWNTETVQKKIKRLMERPAGEHRALLLTGDKPWLVVMPYEDWADGIRNPGDFDLMTVLASMEAYIEENHEIHPQNPHALLMHALQAAGLE